MSAFVAIFILKNFKNKAETSYVTVPWIWYFSLKIGHFHKLKNYHKRDIKVAIFSWLFQKSISFCNKVSSGLNITSFHVLKSNKKITFVQNNKNQCLMISNFNPISPGIFFDANVPGGGLFLTPPVNAIFGIKMHHFWPWHKIW